MESVHTLPWRSPEQESTIVEYVVDAFDTHWVKYIVPSIAWLSMMIVAVLLFVVAGTSVAQSTIVQKILFCAAMLLLTAGHHWFFHRLLSESMQDVVITNRRFMYLESSLWSVDETHEVALRQIKGVDAHKRGLIQNLFRFGQIAIDTGGSDMQDRTFHLIPHPDRKARKITELVRTLYASNK